MALLLLLVGCRDGGKPRGEPGESTGPAAVTPSGESAGQLADRAAAAMDAGELAKAGELFARAATAPDSPDKPAKSTQRFDWRCRAALAYWLAGDVEAAMAACDEGRAALELENGPEAATRIDYLEAFDNSMSGYRGADDPDSRTAILAIVPAVQLFSDHRSDDMAFAWPVDWPTVALLPRLLPAWAGIDAGRLDLANYQVVAQLSLWSGEEGKSGHATTRPQDWQPPESLCYEFVSDILLPVPPRADHCQGVCDWVAWFGENPAKWQTGDWSATLSIGVRRGFAVVAHREVRVGWHEGQPGKPRLMLRDQAESKRLSSALAILQSAMPDGATPIGGRDVGEARKRAELVAATLERVAPGRCPVKLQADKSFYWVTPKVGQTTPGTPGPGTARLTTGWMIPLVAGWLAYHDWQAAPAVLPAGQPAATQAGDDDSGQESSPTGAADESPADPVEP